MVDLSPYGTEEAMVPREETVGKQPSPISELV